MRTRKLGAGEWGRCLRKLGRPSLYDFYSSFKINNCTLAGVESFKNIQYLKNLQVPRILSQTPEIANYAVAPNAQNFPSDPAPLFPGRNPFVWIFIFSFSFPNFEFVLLFFLFPDHFLLRDPRLRVCCSSSSAWIGLSWPQNHKKQARFGISKFTFH